MEHALPVAASRARGLLHQLAKLAPRGRDGGLCFVVHSVVAVAAALVTLALLFVVASSSVPTAALLLVCVMLVVGLQLALVVRGGSRKVGPTRLWRESLSAVERKGVHQPRKRIEAPPCNPSKLAQSVGVDGFLPLPRLQVVLDMDECLIHSCYKCGHCGRAAAAKAEHPLVDPAEHPPVNPVAPSIGCGMCYQVYSSGEPFIVCKRPGVDEFLARVSAFCDTYLFTSATSDYARPVIELLDPHGSVFKGIYTREFTTKTNFISGPVHVKDLTTIMRTPDFSKNLPQMSMAQLLARVVLVDNNPLSFIPQPSNGILVENFYHSINDCALSRVWETLSQLQSKPDVRTCLRPMFRMAETLASLQHQQQQRWRS